MNAQEAECLRTS